MAKWFKRWRSRKGFGIHSPYAFRFIKEVLAPDRSYAYYAYSDIRKEVRQQNGCLPIDMALLVFRTVLELRPTSVCIRADNSFELLHSIVKKSGPNIQFTSGECDLLICEGMAACPVATKHAIFLDCQNPAAAATIEMIRHGHIYKSKKTYIIIAHRHLPFQNFDIKY